MEAIAKTRYLKGSPRKARLVIDLVRGKNVSHALAILKFTNKRAADPIAKCLRSAIANATYKAEQENIAIDPDDLWIKTCFVDMGPTKNRRRLRPAPQGRAFFERRHYCHITIEVTSEPQKVEEEPVKAKAAGSKKKSEAPKAEKKADKAPKAKAEKKAADAEEAKSEEAPKEEAVKAESAEKPAKKETKAKAEKAEEKEPEAAEEKAEAAEEAEAPAEEETKSSDAVTEEAASEEE